MFSFSLKALGYVGQKVTCFVGAVEPCKWRAHLLLTTSTISTWSHQRRPGHLGCFPPYPSPHHGRDSHETDGLTLLVRSAFCLWQIIKVHSNITSMDLGRADALADFRFLMGTWEALPFNTCLCEPAPSCNIAARYPGGHCKMLQFSVSKTNRP